jgi:hypothetical protein
MADDSMVERGKERGGRLPFMATDRWPLDFQQTWPNGFATDRFSRATVAKRSSYDALYVLLWS